MIYKYGGFYLDLDYVVFNDLSQFENIVVGNKPSNGKRKNLLSITNNALQLKRYHPLLRFALLRVKLSYDPSCWTCIGPKLVTKSAQKLAGTKDIRKISKR